MWLSLSLPPQLIAVCRVRHCGGIRHAAHLTDDNDDPLAFLIHAFIYARIDSTEEKKDGDDDDDDAADVVSRYDDDPPDRPTDRPTGD